MTRAAPGGALREGRSRLRSALPAPGGHVEPDAEGPDDEGLASPVPLPVRRGRRLGRVLVLGLAGAGVAAWLLTASPFTRVTGVDVQGASARWAPGVRTAIEREIGTSLVRVDRAGVAARVRAVPGVLRASVDLRWPHTLVVRVLERRPVAGVRVPGGVREFDAEGVDLGLAPSAPGLPLLSVPANDLGAGTVAAAVRVREALPAAVRAQVVELGASTPDGVWFVLRDRTRVLWGSADAPADKAAALAVMRSVAPRGHARTVDVSAPDAPAVS
jgi:cell division protein FtsQ